MKKRDENLLAGMKMFRETLTFRETSRKILNIYVSAALHDISDHRKAKIFLAGDVVFWEHRLLRTLRRCEEVEREMSTFRVREKRVGPALVAR